MIAGFLKHRHDMLARAIGREPDSTAVIRLASFITVRDPKPARFRSPVIPTLSQ